MYTTIIHPIRKALGLSLREYVLLDTIYGLSNNLKYGGWCVASKEYLCETLGVSRRWIFSGLKKLEEVELIVRDPATGYMRTTDTWNEIVANKNDWLVGFDGKETQFVSAKSIKNILGKPESAEIAPIVQNAHSDSAESAPYIYSNNNKRKKILKERKDSTIGDDFDKFWDAYPRKSGKGAARRKFGVALKKTTLAKMIEAVEIQKRSKQWQDIQYVPLPTTWLNQERWDDEVDVDPREQQPGESWGDYQLRLYKLENL